MVSFKAMAIGAVLLVSCGLAGEVAAGQVSPTPAQDIGHNGTSDGSPHVVLNDGTSVAGYRVDCLLQNNGVGILYYKFEAAGVCPVGTSVGSCSSTVTTSDKQLAPGLSLNCNNGVTLSSTALSIMGTLADKYALTEQFPRAQ